MNREELIHFVEGRGYEVRSVRIFKKTFHITYWSPTMKTTAFYGCPLSSIPSKPDGTEIWLSFSRHFPKVKP